MQLTLAARAENAAMVRHVVGALAESLRLDHDSVEDLRLVVTEAFTNVVRHAYGSEEGTVEIRVVPSPARLQITVRDHGHGMGAVPTGEGPGLGLPLIDALADRLEILQPAEGGSVLQITFSRGTGRFQPTS